MNKTDFRTQVFSLAECIYPMVARMLGNTADAEDKAFVFLTARNYCLDLLRKSKSNLVDIHSATAQLTSNV